MHAGDDQSTVLRDGLQVRFDLCFESIEDGIPALVEYLQAQGCTQFDYALKQEYDEDAVEENEADEVPY